MGGIKVGNLDVSKMLVGTNNVKSVYLGNTKIYSKQIESFNAITMNATLPDSSPTRGRRSMGAAKVGNKIYLFGGSANLQKHNSSTSSDTPTYRYFNSILIYDIENDTISTSNTTLPDSYYGLTCAAVGKKIYIFGGYTWSSYYGVDITTNGKIMVYDTESDTLTNITSFSYALSRCVAYDDYIYLFGGTYCSDANHYDHSKYVLKFNTNTNTLTNLGAMPVPSGYGYCTYFPIILNNEIIVIPESGSYGSTGFSFRVNLSNDAISIDEDDGYRSSNESAFLYDDDIYLLKNIQPYVFKHIWDTNTHDKYPLTGFKPETDYSTYLQDGDTWWIFGNHYSTYDGNYPYYQGTDNTIQKIVFN